MPLAKVSCASALLDGWRGREGELGKGKREEEGKRGSGGEGELIEGVKKRGRWEDEYYSPNEYETNAVALHKT